MIGEVLLIGAWILAGALLARSLGVSGPFLMGVGLVIGTAGTVALGAIVVLLGLNAHPAAIPGLFLVAVVVARIDVLRELTARSALRAGLAALAVTGTIAALRGSGAVNITPDTYRYLTTAGLLEGGRFADASGFLLLSRGFAVPILHAPAGLWDDSHTRSVTPLVALGVLMTLAWFVGAGLRGRGIDPQTVRIVQILSVVLLVSINRFVFHGFYINGHLFIAAWLLLLAGSVWLDTVRETAATAWVTFVRCLLVAALVLARPDGVLLAGLALVPLLANSTQPRMQRALPLLALGVTTTGWNLVIAARPGPVPEEVQGMIVLGSMAIITAGVVVGLPRLLPRQLPHVVESLLWLVAILWSIARPRIALASLEATIRNVLLGAGGWGISAGLLGVLVLIAICLTRDPARLGIRFPVTTFVPLSLLLALARGSPYRVGPGDSLNRMLIQVIPLAILLLASTFVATERRWVLGGAIARLIQRERTSEHGSESSQSETLDSPAT